MKENVKLCAVVKADAYGHGMQKVAEKINGEADYFAVATVEEALRLRNITDAEILLFGYFEDNDLKQLIDAEINLTVFDVKTLKKLNSFAYKYNKSFFVHIKYDSGMNRLGYKTVEEGTQIIKTLKTCKNIVLNGLYTHFASGNIKDRDFLLECKNKFDRQAGLFKSFKRNIIIHAAATPTAFLDLDLQYDMVRCGLCLYGFNSNDDVNSHLELFPAIELKAKILQVKKIKKYETVGYNRNFTAKKDIKLATICCGYGDGYSRLLSNKGTVIIDNKPCKICGNICMDLLMADCTKCKKCLEAVLISDKIYKEHIGVEQIAKNNNTIAYEILTSLSNRCQKVYINE